MSLRGAASRLRHLWVLSLVMLLTGCTSGGCASGCAGGPLAPLADGFERERRIENAASVRLTQSGVAFLEQSLGTLVAGVMATDGQGVLSFPVPTSEGSYTVLGFPAVTYTVCPEGPEPEAVPPSCMAEIDLAHADLTFDTEAPHNIRVTGPLPVRIQSLPVDLLWFVVPSTTVVALDATGACAPDPQLFADIDLDVSISIEIDQDSAHSGYGYSRVRIAELSLDQDELGAAIHFCDPTGEDIDEAILNGLKEQMIPALTESIIGTLASQIEQLLCRTANPALDPTCPTGTFDVDGVCRYAPDPEAECATMLLGLDGRLDLGAALATISPRTQGALDFVLAAGGHSERPGEPGLHWGDLDPVTAGATLGLYGGTEPRPAATCVAPTSGQLPSAIPIPDVMTGNTVAGWPADQPGPHVGLAVSERFLNFALEQLYNAGGFCLAITGEQIPMLNSRLISLGIGAPSMQELGHQRAPQPLSVVVRPDAPPTLTIGNGTNVETDPLLRLRAERMSFDFYVWSLDRYVRAMTATVDLDVPANIEVAADGLHPVVGAIGLGAVEVSNARLVREPEAAVAETLQSLIEDMVGSMLGGALPAFDINAPLSALGLRMVFPPSAEGQGSPGLRRLTAGNDAYLGLFASFELASTERSAALETSIELVDLDPGTAQSAASSTPQTESLPGIEPRAVLRLTANGAANQAVEWQVRVDGKLWRPFSRERELELAGRWLLAEGRHEVQARARVIGRPESVDPTPASVTLRIAPMPAPVATEPSESASDAGCHVASPGPRGAGRRAHGLGALAAVWAVARRRRAPSKALAALAASGRSRAGRAMLALLVALTLVTTAGCSCTEAPSRPGCQERGDCIVLRPGLIGAYTSAAVAADGTLWVAGYLEADWVNEYRWGDLVVGRFDGTAVDWTLVDGVPAEPAPDAELFDVGGFRGGQVAPGDDVGLWTSVAIDPAGNPAVAYYDATHRSLRYASMRSGRWTVGIVDQRDFGDVGRYAKLLFVGGLPVVSYLTIEPGTSGAVRSGVRVATASAVDASDAVWSFEEVVSEPATPCRGAQCTGGAACVLATGLCTAPSAGCAEPCLDDTVCAEVDGGLGCQGIWSAATLESHPRAVGLYVSAAPHPGGGFALAFYDRIRGNLLTSRRDGGSWSTRIVDGETDGVDTGDRGVGVSLAIDATGNFHLSYLDGAAETLHYLFVPNGTAPLAPELVDDGAAVDGQPFADRKHKVGDDSHLVVTPSGDVRISYQDATEGTLRVALGTPVSGGHYWDRRMVPQEGFAGAFSRQVVVGTTAMVVNWWRVATPSAQGNVRVLFTP